MTAVTFVGHDPKPRRLGVVMNMIATTAITKGQVVGFNATGVEMAVEPALSGSTVCPIGVALHTQSTAGGKIAIASLGSIVKVQNGVDSALEAGDAIMVDETTAGTVKALVWSAGGEEPIGYMLEALPGTAVTAYAYINPGMIMTKQSH